jgi:OPA family sugar phosphate sensor protein UhpC-like MFS transporter
MKLIPFFRPAPHRPVAGTREEQARAYRRLRISAVSVMVVVYGLYYVCRLSLNVMKKPIVDSGYLNTQELGYIGSALFFAYAVGKCANGFLADRCDIRKFMSVGLFISALANLALGFRMPALLFAVLWGLNGYAQSMGAPASVVGLARWFCNRERGTYYSVWCTSHNLGGGDEEGVHQPGGQLDHLGQRHLRAGRHAPLRRDLRQAVQSDICICADGAGVIR